ncbi:hypothetical protein CHARACLAT_033402 [Characodon lateralis]|uniref:Secreted protein n=1 Tax=Characodon lateralis TaxID=208331 RepID=A0ABU7DFT9_9TELE|nr:hypothetical protein [Characodon lateralis]
MSFSVLHSILIMVQASTLNVAFNSHNKSLLTIMMSNNFVEIKGSVFKKFEKNNLFQMSNSGKFFIIPLNIIFSYLCHSYTAWPKRKVATKNKKKVTHSNIFLDHL